MRRGGPVVVATAALLGVLTGGCDSADPLPQWAAGVGAVWTFEPATLQDLGYQVSVLVEQFPGSSGPCAPFPSTMHIRVDGNEVSPGFDDQGCLSTAVVSQPVFQVPTVSVEVLDGDQVVSQGTFDGLAPGAKATLVAPAGGMVHAGDDIVVVPPPELPSGEVNFGIFFPLDGASAWNPFGIVASAQRLADGVHVTAPALTGRAALVFQGRPFGPELTISCSGFAACVGNADDTLGPVFVEPAP